MRSQEMSIVGPLIGVDPFKSASHNVRIAFADDGDEVAIVDAACAVRAESTEVMLRLR